MIRFYTLRYEKSIYLFHSLIKSIILAMEKEYKLDSANINSQIKFLASLKGYNISKLKEKINFVFFKKDKVSNFSNKMKLGRLRVTELNEIAEILGYEIILREK